MHRLWHQVRKVLDHRHKLCIAVDVVFYRLVKIALLQQCVGASFMQAQHVDAFDVVGGARVRGGAHTVQVDGVFVQTARR